MIILMCSGNDNVLWKLIKMIEYLTWVVICVLEKIISTQMCVYHKITRLYAKQSRLATQLASKTSAKLQTEKYHLPINY